MTISKLLPCVKVPVSGTMLQRSKKAANFVEQLSQRAEFAFENDKINLEKLQKTINNLLPGNVKVLVLGNTDKSYYATNGTKLNGRREITNLTIELSTDAPKGDILADILHEARHVADSLFNPKFLARQQTAEQKDLYTNKVLNAYNDQIDIKEYAESKKEIKETLKIIKRKLSEALRGFSSRDKINILQDFRYGVETEQNAYKEQYKYAQKLKERGFDISEDYCADHRNDSLFEEKHALLGQMIFDLIKKERELHAIKLKKNKIKHS